MRDDLDYIQFWIYFSFLFFFYLRESGSATAQHYSFLLKLILPYDLKVERWAWGRNQRLAVWMWASPAANLGDGICDLSTHVPKSSPNLFHLEPAGAWLVKLVALTAWQPDSLADGFTVDSMLPCLLCSQDAPQINFKESGGSSSATVENCGQWTDRKTNYHRAPRIHAFGWMSGFLVFCWMLIAFQCDVSTPFSSVLRMKPKPAFVLFEHDKPRRAARWKIDRRGK